MGFDIYPAIDLRRGRVVRLQLGDPSRETVFGNDPVMVARRWLEAGAAWLHVVNLDGAFAENALDNWTALRDIVALGGRVQFGGGLRTLADVAAALKAGVTRVVLGTAALENPALVGEAVARFGAARVAVAIDARDGLVRTHGWQADTARTPLDIALAMRAVGVKTVVYTDIGRDGVLTGVNAETTAALATMTGLDVIASGGVRGLEDVSRLLALGPTIAPGHIAGVIIGRALYDGHVDLAAAVDLAQRQSHHA